MEVPFWAWVSSLWALRLSPSVQRHAFWWKVNLILQSDLRLKYECEWLYVSHTGELGICPGCTRVSANQISKAHCIYINSSKAHSKHMSQETNTALKDYWWNWNKETLEWATWYIRTNRLEIDAGQLVWGFRFEPLPCLTFKVPCSCSITVVLWLGSVQILQWSLPSSGLKVSAFNFDMSYWCMLQLWHQSDGNNSGIVLLRERSFPAGIINVSPLAISHIISLMMTASIFAPKTIQIYYPYLFILLLDPCVQFLSFFFCFSENIPFEGWKTVRVLGFLYDSVCKFERPVCMKTCASLSGTGRGFVPVILHSRMHRENSCLLQEPKTPE